MSTFPSATAVILAAGKGTRMNSDLAKVLHPLAGKSLVAHVIAACRQIGVGRLVAVVGYQREAVEAVVQPLGVVTALQDRQLGTGHAVLCAESQCQGDIVVVVCGDSPLIPAALLERLLAQHQRTGAACTAVAARLADPGRYGRMITDAQGRLTRIVEFKDGTEAERAVNLINSGIYAFNRADLFRCLKNVKPNNAQGEYYLTDVVGMLVAEGKPVECVITEDATEVMGINTTEELAAAEKLLVARRVK
jgi:UDP-N-acetylglucosamine diphosphorylase/glucosamine-1-phosphate N-acetyltransferase